MRNNSRLILFTTVLVALTTYCKYYFGPNYSLSGLSPMFAIALFSGYIVNKKEWLFLFPLLSLFISDAIIELLFSQGLFQYAGFYAGQWKNYAILLGSTFIGWALKGKNYTTLAAGAIASPTLFFIVSNFMVWAAATEQFYSKSLVGLEACYVAGLPFYRNSLVGTLLFLPIVLVSFNLINNKKLAVKLA
jgi:hypothetical protein